MTPEEKLFGKISEQIEAKFESIGDDKVKEAVKASFDSYKEMYEEKTEKELVALKAKMDEINKSFEGLDDTQTKEVAKQLSEIEKQLTTFETTMSEIGNKVSQAGFGSDSNGSVNGFQSEIEKYLFMKLPHEDGKVIFDALDTNGFDAVANANEAKETSAKLAVIPTKSMFAAIDHTNAKSTEGQAISRDINTMGFKDIPPILNDHVADIFTTPKMGKNAFMTLRIFHTYTDGVDLKVEGTGTFAKSSVMLKSQDFKVFTYGTQYKISMEEYEDVHEIAAELNKVIPDLMMNDGDEKVFTTDGDNSATPWGAFSTNVT